ncbi:hypothetical protein R1sor_007195 [Riccia sorocarpa]|uniref:LNS2/PITP domain-containing protein n=1 Tax=Riccia sorocarpa TaxID=122646 RepID=A0ABD3HW17_9MARC
MYEVLDSKWIESAPLVGDQFPSGASEEGEVEVWAKSKRGNMFAVGSRVGTLFAQSITQSIYTVSGPFHPFGGAVDIIVVEQEDGSFKSSPWYVKFGKFQGVLKRREKKVVVAVNDVEANFHMFLDHKGEAYFLKDDISEDSLLAIEDSAVPSPNEATSSAGDNSAEPLDAIDSKQEEREDARADHGKEKTEDDGGDAVELMLEGRISSEEVLQQAVCDVESAAVLLELGEKTQSQVHVAFSDQVPWGALASSESSGLFSRNFGHSSSDVSTVDEEAENHACENPTVGLESSGGSSDSSSLFADASVEACCADFESSGETQEPDSKSSRRGEKLIHGLLNEAVGFRELSSPEPSTAVLASAAFESLCRVVSDTPAQPVPGKDDVSEKVELLEEEVAATDKFRKINESIEACSSEKVSFSYVDSRSSYTDVCSTRLETETTTGGTVIHALLNRTVGLEVSQNSSKSTVLVANAALEALTAASLPEITASTETQVCDKESSSRARKFLELLSKAIGLQESARSAPANALIATAVLKSLSNVVSDVHPAISPSDSSAESRMVEMSEEDAAKESEESKATASAEEVTGTGETAIVPVFPSEETSNEKLVVLVGGRQYPWTAPVVLGLLAFGQFRFTPAPSLPTAPGEQALVVASGQTTRSTFSGPPSSGWRLWPFGRSARTPEQVDASALLSGDNDALKRATSRITNEYIRRNGFYKKPRKVRSNCPSSQQLASLNLKEGANKITFTFVTRVLGKQQVDARIYLWKWNTRIVISDVDGTITKSDVLGQVMPLVGKDWTQSGVAKLFSAIKKNGYELMFLSARAISQAHITRNFLEGIKQDGQQLPDGPVVISPDGLFPSLYREVIRRAPHEFKIACLEVIKSLFPPDCKPFYAGFGNRDTDELSYLKVGISKGKIFIINPKGEVMVNNQVDVKSYTSLHTLVHDMFPAVTFTEEEDYNEWNFWKLPLPDIEEEESVKSITVKMIEMENQGSRAVGLIPGTAQGAEVFSSSSSKRGS